MKTEKTFKKENLAYIMFKTLTRIYNDRAKGETKRTASKFIRILCSKNTGEHLKIVVKRHFFRINSSKIKFDCNIVKTNHSDSIEDNDLDKLVENLLDNAINACEKIKDENSRWIDINIYEKENKFLFIDIANSNTHLNVASENDEKYGHGFEYLKTFLKKYGGDLILCGPYVDRFSVKIQVPMDI